MSVNVQIIEEEPNPNAARFFHLLKDSDEPLWDSCTNHNKLSAIAHVFTIIPRLQRLFMSPRTIEHMIWHQSHHEVDGVTMHPFDGKAWKHFNNVHPHFLVESRNVCIGLCTNGFNPFESFIASYSCWPVIGDVYEAGVHVFIYGHTKSE